MKKINDQKQSLVKKSIGASKYSTGLPENCQNLLPTQEQFQHHCFHLLLYPFWVLAQGMEKLKDIFTNLKKAIHFMLI